MEEGDGETEGACKFGYDCDGTMEVKVESRREGKDDEEGEFGKQRREKRGKTEVEEEEVV